MVSYISQNIFSGWNGDFCLGLASCCVMRIFVLLSVSVFVYQYMYICVLVYVFVDGAGSNTVSDGLPSVTSIFLPSALSGFSIVWSLMLWSLFKLLYFFDLILCLFHKVFFCHFSLLLNSFAQGFPCFITRNPSFFAAGQKRLRIVGLPTFTSQQQQQQQQQQQW